MDDNVPARKGEKKMRFVLTIEVDPSAGASGYKVDRDAGFPLMLAAHTLDKCRLRMLQEELMIEAQQIASAQANRITPATSIPKVMPRVAQ